MARERTRDGGGGGVGGVASVLSCRAARSAGDRGAWEGGLPASCSTQPQVERAKRRSSRLPWLVLALMLVCHHAAAAGRWDVKDTHDRLDRIYKKLGIEEPREKPRTEGCQGCTPEEEEQKPEKERPPSRVRAPKMPAWLGYLLIGVILAAMLIPLFLVLKNSFSDARAEKAKPEEEEEEEGDTLVEARGPWVVDLSECRRLVEQGRVAEAFAALHRLTLLGLERMRHLTLDETTTNWEYVRRLISRPELKQVLSAVTLAAERSVLGHDPPGVERYRELERMVLDHVQEGRA